MTLAFDFDYIIKFLVLGNSGVGKTSSLCQYVDETFSPNFISTVGIDFREKIVEYTPIDMDSDCKTSCSPRKVHIQIWDTAGQERYRSLTTTFYRGVVGFILMFDITNRESFSDLRMWICQIDQYSLTTKPVVLLCGNKIDLRLERTVSQDEALRLASEFEIPYVETSALTGQGLDEGMNALLNLVMPKVQKEELGLKLKRPRHVMSMNLDDDEDDYVDLEDHQKTNSFCCS